MRCDASESRAERLFAEGRSGEQHFEVVADRSLAAAVVLNVAAVQKTGTKLELYSFNEGQFCVQQMSRWTVQTVLTLLVVLVVLAMGSYIYRRSRSRGNFGGLRPYVLNVYHEG